MTSATCFGRIEHLQGHH